MFVIDADFFALKIYQEFDLGNRRERRGQLMLVERFRLNPRYQVQINLRIWNIRRSKYDMGLLFRFAQNLHDLIIEWTSCIIAGKFLRFINEKVVKLYILFVHQKIKQPLRSHDEHIPSARIIDLKCGIPGSRNQMVSVFFQRQS